MDKTFVDIVSETLKDLDESENAQENSDEVTTESESTTEENTQETEENNETSVDEDVENYDEDETNDENDVVDEDLDEDDEVNPNLSTNSKDYQAFAKMRTENKQYKNIIDFFDTRAKAMGLQGIDDLMAKTQEAEIAKQAKKEGIPVEYAKKMKELEDRVALQEQREQEYLNQAKMTGIKNSLDGFVHDNNLDDKTVAKLANDLISDGLTLDFFANVPEQTIDRILKSYLPSEISKQKELEKKEKIRNELPLQINSNTSTNQSQEDEIDKLAKMLMPN